jgi:predicted metal-dependent hydrolase
MNEALVIDNLAFNLRRSAKRKTIGITVDRDGSLILSAPVDCPLEVIEHTAREKQFWVYTKLAQKQLLFQPRPAKEFVTGEGFFYLGRSYRLLLVDPPAPGHSLVPLRLRHGRFLLRRDEHHRALEHFIHWYKQHGRPWLQRRVTRWADRIGVSPCAIDLRDLGFRWGSCTLDGKINFHWRTILLPPRIIDYVIAHELAHLHDPHHSAEFWQRLERTMPDYAARKYWLAENGQYFTH